MRPQRERQRADDERSAQADRGGLRRHVEQRGGRHFGGIERQRTRHRPHHRARGKALRRRIGVRRAEATDVCQHRARGVVEHDHGRTCRRRVFERADHAPLPVRVEHRVHHAARRGDQTPCQMRGIVPARFEAHRIEPVGQRAGAITQLGATDARHQFASPPGHLLWRGVGRTQQGRQHRCLCPVERIGRLAHQRARRGVNAEQFTAKWREIEVGLENVGLAPLRLDLLRGNGLIPLLLERSPATMAIARMQGRIEQADQLHGQRRGAARMLVPEVLDGGGRKRAPIDAAMLVKAPVLGFEQRFFHGR